MQNNYNQTIPDTDLHEGQEVLGTVHKFSPLGATIYFGETLEGLLYQQEIYPTLKIGDQLKFYIKKIREDGKIDLTLDQAGYRRFIASASETIMAELRKHGGFLPFNDKSSPDDIRDRFQMSKKKFKETIGLLYKKRIITIEDAGIRIIQV